MTRELVVEGSGGRPVRALLEGPDDAPAVLVAHGFKGFAGWGFFPWLAARLVAQGLRAVRVDFSHNGVEARDFDRLDLFLLDTPTRHQEDLAALAAAVPGPLGLLGHSRGGADVLVFGAREPRVRAVVTLAAVVAHAPPTAGQEAELRTQGFVGVRNARTGQLMPVGRPAFEAAAQPDVLREAAARAVPTLAFHGTEDASVPPAALDALAQALPHARVRRLEGADHTLGARHPFAGPPPQLVTFATEAAAFLARHLA